MNRSLLTSNHPKGQWLPYTPTLDVIAGYTPPPANAWSAQGRYFVDRDAKLCVGEFLGSLLSTSCGQRSASAFYTVSLPVPYAPALEPTVSPGTLTPLGTGYMSMGLFELDGNLTSMLVGASNKSSLGTPANQAAQFTAPFVTLAGIAGQQRTITAASWSANTLTFTVTNDFAVGDSIVVAGMTPSGYNGTWTVASSTTSQFTATSLSNPGTAAIFGTTSYINSSLTSGVITVTFPYTLGFVPNYQDLIVTSAVGLGTDKWYLSAISTTGFSITITKSGGTDTAATGKFYWKLLQDGSTGSACNYASPVVPWDWGNGAGPSLRGHFAYEIA